MKKYLKYCFFLIFIIISSTELLFSEQNTYRVFFKDKGDEEFHIGSQLYLKTLDLFSQDAINRRKKVFDEKSLITIQDAPVNPIYLDRLKPFITEVKLVSRWLNYCVVLCDETIISEIEELEFVKNVQITREILKTNSFDIQNVTENMTAFQMMQIETEDSTTIYGQTASQNNMLNVHNVHNLGISGKGIKIGFIDSGFKYKEHEAFKNSNIIAEYDFIQNDSITENQMFDIWNQHNHGTNVMSVVAGFKQNTFVGIAPSSSIYLAKTESLEFERHIEEDRFAAATEWLESKGVDIINSSLGYDNFDSLEVSYDKSQIDGNSTIVAKYVNIATQKGVLFVISNGNKGPLPYTISSPADADSCIAVGAVLPNGITVAEFSSRGPTYKEIIKPDLSAMGVSVSLASTFSDTAYIAGNGTSFASPLITGVAALYLSVFPESTPYQIKQALYNSASNNINPNNDIGRGVPDIFRAIKNNGIVIAPIITQNSSHFIRIFSNIIFPKDNNGNSNHNEATLYMKFNNNSNFTQFKMNKMNGDYLYVADVDEKYFEGKSALGYIKANDNINNRRMPFNDNNFITINPDSMQIPFNYNINNLPTALSENSEIVIFPNVTSSKNGKISLSFASNDKGNTEFQIYNSLGNRIYKKDLGYNNSGINNELIDISTYPIGIYYVFCTQGNSIKKAKFIIVE